MTTIPRPPESTCLPQTWIEPCGGREGDLFAVTIRTAAEVVRGRLDTNTQTIRIQSEGQRTPAAGGHSPRVGRGSFAFRVGDPPCDPGEWYLVRTDPGKTKLVDAAGRAIKFVTKDLRVIVGDAKPENMPGAADDVPADAAEILITPTPPPCGEYPSGTRIEGQTIRIPNAGVRVYFDVQIRNWNNGAVMEGATAPAGGQDPSGD